MSDDNDPPCTDRSSQHQLVESEKGKGGAITGVEELNNRSSKKEGETKRENCFG